MTITHRNIILITASILALITAAVFVFTVTHILVHAPEMLIADTGILKSTDENIRLYNTALSFFYLLFSLTAGLILLTYFKKSTSEEIFFLILVVISFFFEAVRTEQLLVENYNEPIYYGDLITRLVHFGRVFRTFSLLIAGLFAAGLSYQKYGIFIGIAILIAFTFSGTITVDTSALLDDLLYKIGNGREAVIALIVLKIIAAVNFFLGGFLRNNKDYTYMGAGITMIVIGTELLHHILHFAAFGIGALFLIAGTVLFSNRVHSVYMWY